MVGLAVRMEGNGWTYCYGGREWWHLLLGWKGMVGITVRVEGNDGTYC